MILSIFTGILTGLIMALPPGPAASTLIKLNLTHYKKHILQYLSSVAFLDVFYCLIAMLAASQLLSAFKYLEQKYPFIVIIFQSMVVLFLVVFGIKNLSDANKINQFNPDEPIKVKKKLISWVNLKHPLLLGIAMSITSLASPSFFPSLIFICGFEQGLKFVDINPLSKILFSIGFGMGTFSWLIFLSKLVHTNKHRFNFKIIKNINIFVSFSLIFFGLLLALKIILNYK